MHMCHAVIVRKPLASHYSTTHLSHFTQSYGSSLRADAPTNWSSFAHNKNVVLGIFTLQQEQDASSANPFREINLFESMSPAMSGKNVADADSSNAQFTIQKRTAEGNVHRFEVDYASLATLNVSIAWSAEQIEWTATDKDTQSVLATWTYTDQTYIPTPSAHMFLHFNLWAQQGPSDGKLRHVAITNVTYTPDAQ